MMREIKFRGRKVGTGEWIYGMPTYDFRFIFNSVQNDSPDNYEIITETIGQYTGLKDKKGKEIYEGDIVNASWMYYGKPGGKFIAYIFYNEDLGSFRIAYNSVGGGSEDDIYFRYQIEVIGNIYNNPELL